MNNRQRIKHAPTYSESLEILQGNKKKIKEVRKVERVLIINSSTMAGATLSRSSGFRVNPTVFETGSMYRIRAFNCKKTTSAMYIESFHKRDLSCHEISFTDILTQQKTFT
jgi:hypothetical protein